MFDLILNKQKRCACGKTRAQNWNIVPKNWAPHASSQSPLPQNWGPFPLMGPHSVWSSTHLPRPAKWMNFTRITRHCPKMNEGISWPPVHTPTLEQLHVLAKIPPLLAAFHAVEHSTTQRIHIQYSNGDTTAAAQCLSGRAAKTPDFSQQNQQHD